MNKMKKEKFKQIFDVTQSGSISQEICNHIINEVKPEDYINTLRKSADKLAHSIQGKIDELDNEIRILQDKKRKFESIKNQLEN